MPTRQNSSSGRPKSPRIQVVLPEDLCVRLTALAKSESRTVSNMARVLIQRGVEQSEEKINYPSTDSGEKFRSVFDAQQTRRIRGAPRRLKFYRPN